MKFEQNKIKESGGIIRINKEFLLTSHAGFKSKGGTQEQGKTAEQQMILVEKKLSGEVEGYQGQNDEGEEEGLRVVQYNKNLRIIGCL